MERIFLHEVDSEYLSKLPEEVGVLGFYQGENLLCVTKTGNLHKRVNQIFALQGSDLELKKLFQAADSFLWESYDNLLSALIAEKLFIETQQPESNPAVQTWKSYPYLAINPAEFPFVKMTDFTDEDWLYIGPFRSRFFLMDLMDLMQKLLKLPYCDVQVPPCEKLQNGVCQGWCMLLKQPAVTEPEADAETEDEQTETETPPQEEQINPHLAKLDALLKEAFLHPENGLLEMIQNEKDKYESNLEFIKADLLTDKIELLSKYRAWLIFLYAAKQLSYESAKITVKGGQLLRYTVGDKEFSSPYIDVKYRANELLALNKNLVDEAWILHQEWLEHFQKSAGDQTIS